MADPGSSVGGITFKISVDLSGVNQRGLNDLNKSFERLNQTFQQIAKTANSLSNQLYLLSQSKLGTALRQQASAMTQASIGMNRYAQATTQANSATNQYQQTAKQVAQVNTKTAATFSDLTNAITSAAGAIGAKYLTGAMENFLRESTLLAARVDVLETVSQQVGKTAGYSSGEISALEERLKSLGITTQAARQAIARLTSNQIDLSKATELARISQDAAVISGLNSSQAFEQLIDAITLLQPRLLKQLGIITSLPSIYERLSAETKKTADQFSESEKQAAFLNEVLEKGRMIAGSYESAMSKVGKQYTSLNRYTEEASRSIGELFQPVLQVYVDSLTGLSNAILNSSESTRVGIAALAGFSTTAGAGITAASGLAAAYYLLSAAAKAAGLSLRGMMISLATNPITLSIAAVSGLVAAIVALKAASHESEMQLIRLKKQAAETGVSMLEAQEAFQQAANATNAADFQDAIEKLVNALPQYRDELDKLTTSAEKYRWIMENVGDAQKTSQEYIDGLTKKIKEQEKAVSELRSKYNQLSGGSREARMGADLAIRAKLQEAESTFAQLQAEQKSAIEAREAKLAREKTRTEEEQAKRKKERDILELENAKKKELLRRIEAGQLEDLAELEMERVELLKTEDEELRKLLLTENTRKQADVLNREIKNRQNAINDLVESMRRGEKAITEMTLAEIDARREARREELQEVDQFLKRRRDEQFFAEVPDAKKAFEIAEKYKGLIGKAQSPQQVQQLAEAAREDLLAYTRENPEQIQQLQQQINQLTQMQRRSKGKRRAMIGAELDQLQAQLGARGTWSGMAGSDLSAAGKKRLGELEKQQGDVAAENQRENLLLTTNQQQLIVEQQQLIALQTLLGVLTARPSLPIVRPPVTSIPAPIAARSANILIAADDSLLDPAKGLAGSAANAQSAMGRGLQTTGKALKAARNSLDSLADVASLSAAEMSAMENGFQETDQRIGQLKQHYK